MLIVELAVDSQRLLKELLCARKVSLASHHLADRGQHVRLVHTAADLPVDRERLSVPRERLLIVPLPQMDFSYAPLRVGGEITGSQFVSDLNAPMELLKRFNMISLCEHHGSNGVQHVWQPGAQSGGFDELETAVVELQRHRVVALERVDVSDVAQGDDGAGLVS